MVEVRVLTDPDEFATLAGPLLTAQPVVHTLIASVLGDVRTGARHHPDALWLAATAHGQPVGLAMWTPPWPPYLGPMPADAAVAVADALADRTATLPGLTGELEAVQAAATRFQRRHPSAAVATTTGVRLHALGHLVRPDAPGVARPADPDDEGLVRAWYRGFAADVHQPADAVVDGMRIQLERGTLLLWTVADAPVSLAGRTASAAGVARVGPVYTPPEHRRRGYGAAVTAEAAARALQEGASDVVLFTDLSNPTSNKIYYEVGFRGVRDYLEVRFA